MNVTVSAGCNPRKYDFGRKYLGSLGEPWKATCLILRQCGGVPKNQPFDLPRVAGFDGSCPAGPPGVESAASRGGEESANESTSNRFSVQVLKDVLKPSHLSDEVVLSRGGVQVQLQVNETLTPVPGAARWASCSKVSKSVLEARRPAAVSATSIDLSLGGTAVDGMDSLVECWPNAVVYVGARCTARVYRRAILEGDMRSPRWASTTDADISNA